MDPDHDRHDEVSHDDERWEARGTHADSQPAEFIDTPENEPGDHEPPRDTTGLGAREP